MFVLINMVFAQDIINETGKDGKFIVRDAEQQEALIIEDGNVGITGELSVEQMNEGSVSNPYVVWDPTDKKFKTVVRIFSNISPISKPLVDRTWHNLAYDKVDEAGNLLNVQATAVTWNQFNTDFGWIKLGPADANFAHIYTDRSRFMFNKPVTFYTGEFGAAVGQDLKLQAGGVTRLIFKASNGNVGIGTSTPSAPLHVMGSGKQRIKVASTNDQAGMLIDGNDNDGSWLLQSPLNSTDLRFVNLSTANGDGIRMTLKSDGNVGIGTTDPLSKLSVGGDGNGDAAISGVTASIPGFGVFGEASNSGVGTNYGGYFIARGQNGHGVFGWAGGSNGIGLSGQASGTSGYAVHGWASNSTTANNTGGYFLAGGSSGTGVRGEANHTGSYTNYGGYFVARGQSGHGVHAHAGGSSGYAGFFEGRGYFSGNVGIGITNPTKLLHIYTDTESEIAVFENQSTSDPDGIVIRTGNDVNPDNTNDFIIFQDGDGDTVGSIDGNGTGGVSYNTTSDARLKTKIRDYFDGLQTVNQIKVKQYEKKSAPGVERIGLIAQELQKVYPQAVSGSPTDDVDEDPMMVDYGSLTPILISALQEQNKLIEDLTKRIKYLESN